MDSWTSQTASPDIKFENSPAESFLSAPGEMYPSLFGTPTSATMNPLEIMTPQSFPEDKTCDAADMDRSAASTPAPEDAPTGDKKQSKKRKSWGQVLPEPKTNLPPRKRAKTDDEKEQRRVERVLRNRRAAQSSRERKRLEVEALEKRNKELETALLHAQKTNMMLAEQLNKFRRDSGVASSAFDSFRPNPITFSQELFGSQDGHGSALEQNKPSLMDELLMSAQSNNTVNPASLSPALSPVAEEDDGDDMEEDDEPATTATPAVEAATTENISPDVTQHPAVSVGGNASVVAGLAATAAPGASSVLAAPIAADFHLNDPFSLSAAIDADSYVLESGLLSSPNSSDFEYDHLAGDAAFPFPPTAATNNTFDLFDINEFLNNDEATTAPVSSGSGLAANNQPSSVYEPEAQITPEDPNLQPRLGASAYGCDDGGIAVGVI